MSWNYRFNYWRRKKQIYQPKSKFFYSEKNIDFTNEDFDYEQFFLQEFFTSSIETRKDMSIYYTQHYGPKAYEYLDRKFIEWANGDYHLTDMMRERIVSVMPRFLSDEAKYKLGIHEFLSSIKYTVRTFQKKIETEYSIAREVHNHREIIDVFEREFDNIQSISIQPVKYDVLSENEKNEILEICKYILVVRLQQCIDQIVRDFNVFIPIISKFRSGAFSAYYHVSRLNLSIDLASTDLDEVTVPKFIEYDVDTDSRFKEYSDKYLAWELVSMHKENSNAICKSFLNSKDLIFFHNEYEKLSLGENKVDMRSKFQGEGGVLELKIHVFPVGLIKKLIKISVAKLLIYCLASVISVSLLRRYSIIGLYLGVFLFFFIYSEYKKIKSLIKELYIYG